MQVDSEAAIALISYATPIPSPVVRRPLMLPTGKDQILTSWNPKHKGWGLPGGKVESLESAEVTITRELREEVGVDISTWNGNWHQIYTARWGTRTVIVFAFPMEPFRDATTQRPEEPIRLMTVERLLDCSPFAPFYCEMFRSFGIGL
jgi:8-oxo-dGTP pyrophosphatase MutT (NUDIX family)